MAESSDVNEPFVFYRDRSEWNDVKPKRLQEHENSIVRIQYTSKFQDVFDYLRAILSSGEKSERVLELTKDAVALNPASYTTWQYRREVLIALKSDLTAELNFVGACILGCPKNYQVWHHRRVLVEILHDPSGELDFTEKVLFEDSKNYHAWQYRQWILKTFKLFDKELEYTSVLIDLDLRNNSAWNQRFFVIKYTTGFTEKVIECELKYAQTKIEIAPDNESAWNYYRGVIYVSDKNVMDRAGVKRFVEKLFNHNDHTPYLLSFIIELCEENLLQEKKQRDEEQPKTAEVSATENASSASSLYSLKRAQDLCTLLAERLDRIRAKFWLFTKDQLTAQYAVTSPSNIGND